MGRKAPDKLEAALETGMREMAHAHMRQTTAIFLETYALQKPHMNRVMEWDFFFTVTLLD